MQTSSLRHPAHDTRKLKLKNPRAFRTHMNNGLRLKTHTHTCSMPHYPKPNTLSAQRTSEGKDSLSHRPSTCPSTRSRPGEGPQVPAWREQSAGSFRPTRRLPRLRFGDHGPSALSAAASLRLQHPGQDTRQTGADGMLCILREKPKNNVLVQDRSEDLRNLFKAPKHYGKSMPNNQ